MHRSLVLAVLLAGCHQTTSPGHQSQPIIGGEESMPGEFPTTGVILTLYDFGGGMSFGSMTCTGTLIAPDVVMTAAHCTLDLFGGAIPFETYFSFTHDVSQFGMQSNELPPDAVLIRELVPHPEFDFMTQPSPGLQNFKDVGLAFLTNVVPVTPSVVSDDQDAPLLVVGTDVTIAGYGQRQQNGQQAGVKYDAPSFINEIAEFEMQIGNNPPGDAQKCHGDSGGPTFVQIDDGRAPRERVIGITSRAYDPMVDCNAGGIDMRADAFRTWFDQTMRDQCTQGLRPAAACQNGGGLPLPGGQLPPIDAGFVDTGVAPDTGSTPDAGTPTDAGGTPQDAAVKDSGPGGSGGSIRRDEGCGCAASGSTTGGSLAILLLLGLFVIRRRAI